MALVRINPAAALMQVRQVAYDLRRAVADAGPMTGAPPLAEKFDALDVACATDAALPIEVWCEDGTPQDVAARWLLGDARITTTEDPDGRRRLVARIGGRNVALMFSSAAAPLTAQPGTLAPPMIVCLAKPDDALQVPPDRCLCFITTAAGKSAATRVVVARTEPDGVLARLFGTPARAQSIELLHAAAGIQALDALVAIVGLAFDQESRSIRARRVLLQQRITTGQLNQPQSPGDLAMTLRTRVQHMFADFTRGLEDRCASALSNPASALWQRLEQFLSGLERLDEETRSRAIVTTLPAEAEQEWLRLVHDGLTEHCTADVSSMRDMLRVAGQTVEQTVADAGGPQVVAQFQPIGEERMRRLIDAAVRVQRRYEGSIPQHGFFEYVAMARRYQMIVFMLLSAFGLGFLRSNLEFMIPAAVVLLSAGAVHVVHTVGRERSEHTTQELEKARELVRTETRRMLAEIERGWPPLVTQHLGDQVSLVLSRVESTTREHFARAAVQGTDERQRLQRQLQGFESAERKLAMPQKTRESVGQAVAQMRGELAQLIGTALQGATAAG